MKKYIIDANEVFLVTGTIQRVVHDDNVELDTCVYSSMESLQKELSYKMLNHGIDEDETILYAQENLDDEILQFFGLLNDDDITFEIIKRNALRGHLFSIECIFNGDTEEFNPLEVLRLSDYLRK
jgi:hypothetical protein